MDLDLVLAIVSTFAVLQCVQALPRNEILVSDNCDVLIKAGFDVFRCTTSAYADRAECVPRGHRSGGRMRLRRPGSFDPMNRVCDSKLDCKDGSDEMLNECTKLHKEYCVNELEKEVDGEYLDSFHCYDEGDVEGPASLCVSECQMCDGVRDCPNGADELDANCQKMRPMPFACELF
ncbi:low-density lipoprotein receptor-like [Lytechinus pictus]|uniref:low-density lipoprotein receptor-like n=1 Tax=Lytechinus pictus TaxID=7653 RepID=UPI0030B9B506